MTLPDGSRGYLPADPDIKPEVQKPDGILGQLGFVSIMAFVILFAILI